MNPNYEQFKQLASLKEYKFFDTGEYNVNIWIERPDNNITNKFDSTIHLLYRVNGVPLKVSFQGNSKPGINAGKTISMICPGQYLGVYQWISRGKGWDKYPFDGEFFTLQGLIKVWAGQSPVINFEHVLEVGANSGTDGHKQSNPKAKGYPVGAWSLACWGAEEPNWSGILVPIIEEAMKRYGDKFSVTFFETKDFELLKTII